MVKRYVFCRFHSKNNFKENAAEMLNILDLNGFIKLLETENKMYNRL